jgi:hypothetical protein
MMVPNRGPAAWALACLPVFCLAALVGVQAVGVPSTNLGGFDEWLVLDVVSRGIIGAPYANRPFNFFWLQPASWLPGYGFRSFAALFAVYTTGGAWILHHLCRRLVPSRPALAFLAAAFFIAWTPSDLARLGTIDRAHYSGITFGTLAAMALLVEAWVRGRPMILLAGMVTAVVAAGSYEGSLLLLAAAPFLLRVSREDRRRWWVWALGWEGVLVILGAFAAAPILGLGPKRPSYQGSVLGLSAGPATWLSRMGRQYLYHLLPLVTSAPSELLVWKVPLTVVLLSAGIVAATRSGSEPGPDRDLTRAMLGGLVFAGLGYGVVVLGMAAASAYRLEFLAGPGIAVFLATLVCRATALVRPRWRLATTIALAGWVAAVGAGRLVAMQGVWDAGSSYPRQSQMLRGLTRVAPDLKPGTMVIVLDEGGAWRANFTFEHAVRYLYEGRAAGCAWKAWAFLYHTSFEPQGLRLEPLPEIREAFHTSVHTYRYDEIVVVRFTRSGEVELMERWPAALPPLPEGARYDPGSRIVRGGPPIPGRGVLSQG